MHQPLAAACVACLLRRVVTAFISAWLDNVTTMLLICPVTISVMRQCNKDPVPLMLSLVSAGGAWGQQRQPGAVAVRAVWQAASAAALAVPCASCLPACVLPPRRR